MSVKLADDERKKLREELQYFFEEERGEKIGIIAADAVIDFFMEDLGTLMYNKALDQARVWFKKRIEDIDIDYDLLYKDS